VLAKGFLKCSSTRRAYDHPQKTTRRFWHVMMIKKKMWTKIQVLVSIDGSSSNHHGEIEGLDLQLSLRANHRGDEDTA
ncbi:hypothetical protein HID58_019876, partial [Brassica napus]